MELTSNSIRLFPYLLPSDILGRSLNISSGVVPTNRPAAPVVSRLATPPRVLRSTQNPSSNPDMGGAYVPSISLPNVGSQFLPPTSEPARGSYVPILHNISGSPPPSTRPSGHVGLGPIGPAS